MNSKEGVNEGDFYGRSKDKSLVVKVKFDKKGDIVARFGLKLLFGATLVSFISAAIAGFFI